MTLAAIRKVAATLDVRVELLPRGRGADLDRLLSARHSALHESVARALAHDFPAWMMASEESFAIWGERGIIDLLLWHPGRRALLIIEFKTELVDVGDLLGTMDRRRRLAAVIAEQRGWFARTVSAWIIVAESRTNQRRIAEHRTVLRNAYPANGRQMRRWLTDPVGPIAALSLWAETTRGSTAPVRRVGRAAPSTDGAGRTPATPRRARMVPVVRPPRRAAECARARGDNNQTAAKTRPGSLRRAVGRQRLAGGVTRA
jgi:hypothetical protein